jgi:hypothetical protein
VCRDRSTLHQYSRIPGRGNFLPRFLPKQALSRSREAVSPGHAANRRDRPECIASLPSWSCGFDSRRPLAPAGSPTLLTNLDFLSAWLLSVGRAIACPSVFAAQQGYSGQIMAAWRPDRTFHFLPAFRPPLSWRCKFKSRRPLPHHAAPPDQRTAATSLPARSARTTERPQSARWRNARRRRGRRVPHPGLPIRLPTASRQRPRMGAVAR